MFHIFLKELKLNLKNKTLVFWTLFFPIILASFFRFGLYNMDNEKTFLVQNVALVEKDMDKEFISYMDSIDGEIVEVKKLQKKEAKEKLMLGEVNGIYYKENGEIILKTNKEMVVREILLNILKSYEKNKAINEKIIKDGKIPKIEKNKEVVVIERKNLGGRNVSLCMPYYFSILAMSCLYMCFLGEEASKRTQANITEMGKRITLSPVPRLNMVFISFMSALVVAIINISIIMYYLVKVIKVLDIRGEEKNAALILFFGSVIGVSFGILIESIGNISQGIKSSILIGLTMLCAFLSGLMISSMKDIVERHVPILNRINPAALIADSFYSIIVLKDELRLRCNLTIMFIISIIFLFGGWILTRRMRYDSI